MANSQPRQINKLTGVDQWLCTNLEPVELRYKWVIRNVGYFSDELKSPVFAANQNKLNATWQLNMKLGQNTVSEYKLFLILTLVSAVTESVRMKWNVFEEDCKGNLNKLFGSELIKLSPGYTQTSVLPYTQQQLLSTPSDLFKDNMLTLVVHITMINPTQQQSGMVPTQTGNGTLIEDLAKLLDDPEYSDVTIVVGDTKIPVHKNILSLRSDVFAAMFRHELREKKTNHIIINDFDSCVIREMLSYIYTGDTSKVSQMAGELLRAADIYNLKGLKEACIFDMYSKLSIETAVQVLVAADLHSVHQLKRHTINFINAHSTAISKTDTFVDLMKNYPHIVQDIFGSQQISE